MQLALDALSGMEQNYGNLWQVAQTPEELDGICNALRAELAKPEPKPVAWMMENTHLAYTSLYFEPRHDWHESWKAVPLYRKEDVCTQEK